MNSEKELRSPKKNTNGNHSVTTLPGKVLMSDDFIQPSNPAQGRWDHHFNYFIDRSY